MCNDVVAVVRANSVYKYGSRFIQAPLAEAPVTALPQHLRSMPPTAAADKSAYSYVRAAKSHCNVIDESSLAGWLARCGSCDLCLARLVFRLINKTRTHTNTHHTHISRRVYLRSCLLEFRRCNMFKLLFCMRSHSIRVDSRAICDF